MLKHLHITNFAIVDKIDIDLQSGMTALTGETGAGKSILLDALGLVLGDRGDSGSIREGAERADIHATFDINNLPGAQRWLSANDLESQDECLLRRTLSADGRSKGYINGAPVTMQMLRELGEMLVDIHGQHEHQSLLKREVQRQRLDDYAGNTALLGEISSAYQTWDAVQSRYQQLLTATQQRDDRLSVLRFQAEELDKLQLGENEWGELQDEHQRRAHANRLTDTANQALHHLYDDDSHALYSLLSQQHRNIEDLIAFDNKLAPIAELLNGVLIQTEEAASLLRGYLNDLEMDPARLQWLEERMSAIHDLARKHRCEPEQLPALTLRLQTELSDLEQADDRLQALANESKQLRQTYLEKAQALRLQRQQAAARLSKSVSTAMQTLGMAGGKFHIQVSDKPYNPETGEGFTVHGLDQIEFQVSTNPGQSLRSMTRVASGGELSRISLAIQMITADMEPIPTLIFDEVDAGIGGGIAVIVGLHLRAIGDRRQVLCVTHLPQVAAQAHSHLRVSKSSKAGTHTAITQLEAKDRIDEIARMLGGVEITAATRNHAMEMVQRAGMPAIKTAS
ncbi:MAG TPA: DNA repair protein RecN [Gammaproteobacteria bacterium]